MQTNNKDFICTGFQMADMPADKLNTLAAKDNEEKQLSPPSDPK